MDARTKVHPHKNSAMTNAIHARIVSKRLLRGAM